MDENWKRLGRLPPETKIAMCMEMSDACVQVCAENIKAQNPGISEEELIAKLRERLAWSKRHRKR